MKKYRLKNDLPTFNAGDEFRLEDSGLWKDKGEQVPILAYSAQTLEKFPNILTDWFAEIPEQPKTVWDLEKGEPYKVLNDLGQIEPRTYLYDGPLDTARSIGNAFLNREEAEKELARRKAKQILLRDTKGFKVSMGVNKFYYVSYDIYDHDFDIGYWCTDCAGGELTSIINFATRDDAAASIKAHEKEWLTYLGVE